MRAPRTYSIKINEGTLKDLIAAHLYSISAINDDEEVTEIEFGNRTDGLGIIYTTIKNKEVELIVHS